MHAAYTSTFMTSCGHCQSFAAQHVLTELSMLPQSLSDEQRTHAFFGALCVQ